ncbi:MAG: hypothetical protein LC808_08995 [Actinobacteria bacterium]|nr:hypothetical protein [Actinomycetota bacterium]
MRRGLAAAVIAAALIAVGSAAASNTGTDPKPLTEYQENTHTDVEARRAATPREQLPPTADDFAVLGVWRNCKFHIISVPVKRFVRDTPDGRTEEEELGDAEPLLPPRDPNCDNVNPTQAQIDEMKRQTEDVQQDMPDSPPPPAGDEAPGPARR